MASLFDEIDERRRDSLMKLGWAYVPLHGTVYWRKPDGTLVTEPDAFFELELSEWEEGGDGKA